MGEVRFDANDVANIRFAISPLWETVASLRALADPGRHVVHLPWIKTARTAAQGRDLAARTAPLLGLTGRDGSLPAFLTPPPNCPLAEFEEELAIVLATPAARVRADLEATQPSSFARALAEDPERELPRLVDAVRGWWLAAIEPHWSRMRAVLEADISHRARQLAEDGLAALFDSLHPTLRWAGDRLVSTDPRSPEIELRGRGLPLTPSVYANRCVLLAGGAASSPVAIYPARAVGTLWEGRRTDVDGLARLLGRSRARLLGYTSSPSTTTQLAARTGLSLGAVSQHLAVLREAGLVTSSRYRREVNYTASDLGAALLDRA
ncbi:winged helix-turn-helix transcriptional regulator [Solihabitans fulvus]|uniref:Winged helix-turn-helix transcriptional regulator n=1 Tax=Solihabitans fulvus TaxID=1892852 RepID=A0A5B2WT16_9PSEU|nr:DUF5937 family protein [Solihabitans fulvus]KAA2254034.1 winged helix-turn-helix transcriptional regulator [Solihabitans fulvus]